MQLVEKGYFAKVRGAPALISYVAVSAAGMSNIVFSRKNELLHGATLTDSDGRAVGHSVIAGRSVVTQTALSRGLFIPMPVLLLPPLLMTGLQRLRLVPANPRLKLGLEVRTPTYVDRADMQSRSSIRVYASHCGSDMPMCALYGVVAQLVVITSCLGAALPMAMGMFPQRAAFKTSDLEPQFHNLIDKQGRKIDTLYSNKGL